MRKQRRIVIVLLLIMSFVVMPWQNNVAKAAKKPTLNSKKIQISIGGTYQLKVKNKGKKAKVYWKSKDKKVASVTKKGKVTGKKKGSTKIVCTIKKGKKKKNLFCKVLVKAKQKTVPTVQPTDSSAAGVPVKTSVPTVNAANPLITAVPAATPTATPGYSYNPNWPSNYSDNYESLKDLSSSFLVGSAIAGSEQSLSAIHDPDMVGILQKHYNSTTFTNLMKPIFLLDEANSKKSEDGMPAVNFDSCKNELQFCKDTGIKLRGHVLVWYNQTPEWFFHKDYDENKELVDKATMKLRMESYIKQVVTYVQTNYPGVVYCWDVVNEAVGDNGEIRAGGNNWYEVYAEGNSDYKEYEYVKDAFTYAKKYVEDGVALVYNDYNTFVALKRQGILDMIDYVNKDEKLIDTIGMQCPILQSWPLIERSEKQADAKKPSVESAIIEFAQTKLDLMVTELCVRTNGGNTQQEIETQAARYKEMYQLLYDMDVENGGPAQITSVTTFGIADSYRLYSDSSWGDGDQSRYGWLFDKNCKAKLGFKCVYNVFAKAAGKKTVEETYEAPEERSGVTHLLQGKLLSKNGKPLSGIPLYFYEKGGDYNSYDALTDENGVYSVRIPEGSYVCYSNDINLKTSILITSSDKDTIDKDIILLYDFYKVYAKAVDSSGTVLKNAQLQFISEAEDTTRGYGEIVTDENGEFHASIPEGTVRISTNGYNSEAFKFELLQDVNMDKPMEVKLPYKLVVLTGKVDTSLLSTEMENYVYLYNSSEKYDNNSALVQEDGTYSFLVKDGEYKVILCSDNYDEEIYYADINLEHNTELDITSDTIHTVHFTSDVFDDLVGIELNDYYVLLNNGTIKLGNITGTIQSYKTKYSESEKVEGYYSLFQPFEVSTDSPMEIEIKLNYKEFIIPKLIEGAAVETSSSTFFDSNNYQSGKVMYSFTPEKTGQYEFFVNSGKKADDEFFVSLADDADAEFILDYIDSEKWTNKVDLVGGTTYIFGLTLFAVDKDRLFDFSFGVKKATGTSTTS